MTELDPVTILQGYISKYPKTPSFLFDSLYNYFDATQLSHWYRYRALVEFKLAKGFPIKTNHIDIMAHHGRTLFPNLQDPTMSAEDFAILRQQEKDYEQMDPTLRDAIHNEECSKIAELIEASREDGTWQSNYEEDMRKANAPFPHQQVLDYLALSSSFFDPLIKACNPTANLLEAMIASYHARPQTPEKYRAYQGFFDAWFRLRVAYEGVSPYTIKFSDHMIAQMEDADPTFDPILAVDPNTSLHPRDLRHIRGGLSRAVKAGLL